MLINMEALDGPLEGKVYIAPDETKTIIDFHPEYYLINKRIIGPFITQVVYERTPIGWKEKKKK